MNRLRISLVIIILLAVSTTGVLPSYGGMEEDMAEIKKELSEIKKELSEIKRFLGSRQEPPQAQRPRQFTEASIDDDPILGDKDAPLTLIEFSDYQCPFCGRFFRETLPLLKKEYISKGKVRYVFRDFPIRSIHPYAEKAAEAAECAGEQDRYWDMHDIIFKNQMAMDIDALKRHANDLKLDMVAFNKCLDSGRFSKEVDEDFKAGVRAGVRGTPSFVLGRTTKDGVIKGRFIRGAQPYQAFKAAIEDALKNR